MAGELFSSELNKKCVGQTVCSITGVMQSNERRHKVHMLGFMHVAKLILKERKCHGTSYY